MNRWLEENAANWITTIIQPDIWGTLGWIIIKILLYVVVGRLIIYLFNRTTKHFIIERERKTKLPVHLNERRKKTIGRLVNNTVSYAVNFMIILLILSELGVNLAPLLAGAGVLGLAIGFGAQSLIKDVITGFFIIFEDQFAVGDVIKTGQVQGTVEEIGLRITKIKSWTGELHIIPNGSITEITNFSIHNSIGVIDIAVSYETNIDKALEVIHSSVKQIQTKNGNVITTPQVLGVQSVGANEVIIRVTVECKPMTHADIIRELNADLKEALAAAGIQGPYSKMLTLER